MLSLIKEINAMHLLTVVFVVLVLVFGLIEAVIGVFTISFVATVLAVVITKYQLKM